MSERENRFCVRCGAKLEPGDAFCVNCGAKVEDDDAEARTTAATATETAKAAKKPRGKLTRLLVTALIVALAYGGGKLLGGLMARDYVKSAAPTRSPLELNTPSSTLPPEVTVAPVPTLDVGGAGSAAKLGWNAGTATDLELRQAMDIYFSGTQHGGFAALFMDNDADHGGFFYTDDRNNILLWAGSWDTREDSDNHITLIDDEGKRHVIYMTPISDDELTIVSAGGVKIDVYMQRGEHRKEELYEMLLKIKNGNY